MLAVAALFLAAGAQGCADTPGFKDAYGGTCASWAPFGIATSDCAKDSSGYVVTCGPPAKNSAGQTFNRGSEQFPAVDRYGQACQDGSFYYSGYYTAAQSLDILNNCQLSCRNCPVSSAKKDPHFTLPHGGRADFRGEHGSVYNLLSAKNVSFSAEFEKADFKWAKRTIHGTKLAHAYWTIRTATGELVNIEFGAGKPKTAVGHHATVSIAGEHSVVSASAPFRLADLAVTVKGHTLTVMTGKWNMTATSAAFPFAKLNPGKVLLDIAVTPMYDADADIVAPHGIIGQAWDGDEFAVHGKIDRSKGADEDMTTTAQGEGAIEGAIGDYKLSTPFATNFTYSRFDALAAPHRDVSKLTGAKNKDARAGRTAGSSHSVEEQA